MNQDVQIPRPAPQKPVHWPSAAQFGFSLFAMALLFSGALLLLISGLYGAFQSAAMTEQLLPLLLMTASFFGMGVLLIPSAYYGLFHLLDRPTLDGRALLQRLHPAAWLALFPVILVIGFLASQNKTLSLVALPALHVFAVGLPIAWLVWLAAHNLPLGSSQRMWGVFNTGLVLGPFIISILEGLAIVFVLLGVGVYIASQPELLEKVMALAESNGFGRQPTPDEVFALFGPYMLSKGAIFLGLTVGAVIVPLIEEAIKPLGVWLLAGRRLSAPAGFAAGALSGAGFALSESLLLTSNGADWTSLILVRIGTGSIHVLTAALTGWALALAWKRRRFGLLALSYLTAVLIHGLWNGLTIVTIFAQAAQTAPGASPLWSGLLIGSPLTLMLMAAGAVILLAFFNRRLAARMRRASTPEISPPTVF